MVPTSERLTDAAAYSGRARTRLPVSPAHPAPAVPLDAVGQPPGQVDASDRAARVAGEEAALARVLAAGNDVLVAGEQADLERRRVRRRFLVRRRPDLRLDPDLHPQCHPLAHLRASPVDPDGERHDLVLVAAGYLPGARLVERQRLRIAVGDLQVVLQRPADHGLV